MNSYKRMQSKTHADDMSAVRWLIEIWEMTPFKNGLLMYVYNTEII